MTDRELLRLAAIACAELRGEWVNNEAYFDGVLTRWNPLTDDGDALRLAVRLGIDLIFSPEDIEAVAAQHSILEGNQMISPFAIESWTLTAQDTYAATRRAIVQAAAEIGKTFGE